MEDAEREREGYLDISFAWTVYTYIERHAFNLDARVLRGTGMRERQVRVQDRRACPYSDSMQGK